MKIKRKDLIKWVNEKTPIKYRGEIYRAQYNGQFFFLSSIVGGDSIAFYNKGQGVFGLVTNK